MPRPAWIEQLRVAARGPEACLVTSIDPEPEVIELRADDHEAVAHHERRGYRRVDTSVRHVRCTDGELWDAVLLAAPTGPAAEQGTAIPPPRRLELVA